MVSLSEFPRPPKDLRYDATDPQVGVVRFEREGKRPVVLTNFGCHALSLWDVRGNISGDYPGRMAAILAEEGIDALFFQGALGNVHPVRETDDPCGRIGKSLARTVRQVCDSLEPAADTDLKFTTKTIDLAPQPMQEVAAARQEWEAQPPDCEGLARYQYWLARHYEDRPGYSFTFHAITIGDAVLLHMPGEPFAETTLAIREAVSFDRVLILCNPCPEAGYLPTPEAHKEGGDEPLFAALHDEAEAEIRRAAIDLLNDATA